MQIGANFPATLIGNDPVFIRDYVQAIEGAGYDYIRIIEHVTGAHPSRFENPGFVFRPKNSGVTYTHETPWHEPLTTVAFLSGVTTTLGFTTSVLLMSQRQAVLVAKQVAELDILSAGRFRLSVGIGWNFTEYEALGMDWKTRTARIEEQIQVLRMLWTQELVDFKGQFHTLDRVGINPLPPSGADLKILYASSAREVVLDRTARLADGWMPLLIQPDTPQGGVALLHQLLEKYGKDPATFQIDASCSVAAPGMPPAGSGLDAPVTWRERFTEWRDLGASHIMVSARAASARETLDLALENRRIVREEFGV